jgi:hypothetical protein
MKKQLLTLLFLTITTLTFAQTPELAPCGTAPVKSEWLINYQKNPAAFQQYTRNSTTLYAGITLHALGSTNGGGYILYDRLMEGFCDLNKDFQDADIQFFIEGEINTIDSSEWLSHSTVLEGAEMMFANNVPNTLNCYVVSNPAGNAGYNLPYAGIALSKNAASAGSHTWSHEVGHNFSIQHPFLGWEGKIYNYNTPTPTTVTYDYTYFKDTLIIDTLIIDTAFVELTDGSNCTFAADGFCDTSPDYLSFGGWACNAQGESNILLKDPNGVDFRSDATNIMTYSNDACVTRFTPEQIAAMRAYLQTERSAYLYNQNPMRDSIGVAPTMISPINGDIEQFDFVNLNWESVPNATHYVLQLSRFASFAVVEYNAIVSDTSVILTELLDGKTYYWKVKAFNQGYTCAPISPTESFETQDVTRTENINSIEDFRIYPTVLESGQLLNIEIESRKNLAANLAIYNIAGQRVLQQNLDVNAGRNKAQIAIPTLSGGTYIIQIQTAEGVINEKMILVD